MDQTRRELASVRAELAAARQQPDGVPMVEPKPVVDALHGFVSGMAAAHATVHESVDLVARWFDHLVDGQLELDRIQADLATPEQ
ncbi:hypothetical protein ACGFIR_25585 [Micromonospora sp. NPDC049051]|uniref:hypothetical protein n=1 Tax=unclassified Micromonospora TaxID=2617518 RepID=UPI00371D0921